MDPRSEDSPVERALDDYLRAALRGEAPDIDDLAARSGEDADEVRRRLREFESVLGSSAPAGDTAPLPFDRLGEFRLLRRLGEGGMGVVFLAEQETLRRLVALKVVRPERAGSPSADARFLREAQTLARLQHPGIVGVFASGEERGVRYIAMELAPGKGLDELLAEAASRGERLAVSRWLPWMRDVARALAFAHRNGVVHRDVKPSNVRIRPDGRALLVDFGLARAFDGAESSIAAGFRGTPHYASPEQVDPDARGDVDGRSDVYGLGVTLYECACGRVPFEGDSAEQLFHQILSREPPPPRAARAAISRDLETVIRTAMAKERDRRYPDADALAEDLDALLEARPIRARPPGRLRRAVSWSRRHRPATAALATAAVASIAFAGFLVHRRAAADRELVASAIEEASSRLAEFRSLRASLSSLRDRVAAETRRFEAAHMPRAELESFRRDEDELARARRRLVELPVEAAEALRRAEVRDPSNAAARDLLADLHAEQWREALQTGDEIAAALHEAKTRENDPAGRHSRELDGTASVELAGAPDGAEVHLFRFELLSRVRPDGERRLVAVPFHPDRGLVLRDGGEIRPGDVVLEIEPEAPGSSAAEADLRPGDLVASIEGHPIEEANLVIEVEAGGAAARAGIRTGDRLVGLGSRAIGPDGSLEAIATTYEDGDPVAAVFARDGRETRVAVVKTKEPLGALLGVSIRGADALCSAPLPEPGFEFRGVRDGAPFRARRAPGASGTARAMRTADPLLVSADNRLGAAPIAPFAVPPGSYLLLVRAPGMDPLRLPVLATRGASVHAIASVIPAASGPPGFVRVPPGPFVCGGDPEALRPFDRHVVDLPGFWIARYETTVGEYAEFVNDPSTRARIDAASAQGDVVHIPRSADRPAGYWRRGADGRFQPNRNSREPVLGVSFDDATAYAEWRTARAREAGERWVYGLPTEDEWEKAARGVDGRAFAWGNVFDWRLCRAAWTRASPRTPEPVGSFVRGASVFGAQDMTGSAAEWCIGTFEDDRRPFRGGAWTHGAVAFLRAASRAGGTPKTTHASQGFRLVARERERD